MFSGPKVATDPAFEVTVDLVISTPDGDLFLHPGDLIVVTAAGIRGFTRRPIVLHASYNSL